MQRWYMPHAQLMLKQCFWLSLWIQTILGVVVAAIFPGKLPVFFAGVVLATGYIYLVAKNATAPQPKLQGIFSLGRMAVLGLAAVMLGRWNIVETGVVLLGFLGYNLVLILFALWCALKQWKCAWFTAQKSLPLFFPDGEQP